MKCSQQSKAYKKGSEIHLTTSLCARCFNLPSLQHPVPCCTQSVWRIDRNVRASACACVQSHCPPTQAVYAHVKRTI